MAVTNATTLADYASGIGTQGATLEVDATNKRIGIASESPTATLDIGGTVTIDSTSGVVTATSFSGDGSSLTGIANTDYVVGTAITMVKANFTDVNVSGSATVDGQLSVGGTITYEDVTQVDSVGIVTAGLGIRVLSGGIQVVGLTTGLNATGVSTFATINATSYDEIEYDTWLFG
tara:strand:+ start:429 stop:956 length:528 start_codon:yes stop_codon:yes gene_type:complete